MSQNLSTHKDVSRRGETVAPQTSARLKFHIKFCSQKKKNQN